MTKQKQDEDGLEEQIDMDGFDEPDPQAAAIAKKRTQINTRGSSRSQKTGVPPVQPPQPLVYVPKQKTESEDEKVLRYERVIDKLKKMLEHERRLLKGARQQYQREMSMKTELE